MHLNRLVAEIWEKENLCGDDGHDAARSAHEFDEVVRFPEDIRDD